LSYNSIIPPDQNIGQFYLEPPATLETLSWNTLLNESSAQSDLCVSQPREQSYTLERPPRYLMAKRRSTFGYLLGARYEAVLVYCPTDTLDVWPELKVEIEARE
jgi:hypothetical protein